MYNKRQFKKLLKKKIFKRDKYQKIIIDNKKLSRHFGLLENPFKS